MEVLASSPPILGLPGRGGAQTLVEDALANPFVVSPVRTLGRCNHGRVQVFQLVRVNEVRVHVRKGSGRGGGACSRPLRV